MSAADLSCCSAPAALPLPCHCVQEAKASGVAIYSFEEFRQLGRDNPAAPGGRVGLLNLAN